jgi:hypothetical protein
MSGDLLRMHMRRRYYAFFHVQVWPSVRLWHLQRGTPAADVDVFLLEMQKPSNRLLVIVAAFHPIAVLKTLTRPA